MGFSVKMFDLPQFVFQLAANVTQRTDFFEARDSYKKTIISDK
jgi:hypothetical protein